MARECSVLKFFLATIIFVSVGTYGKSANKSYEKDSIPPLDIYYFQDDRTESLTDEQVIHRSEKLFKLNDLENHTNEVENPNTVIWLNFKFVKPLERDLLIDFMPYYKKVTLYYFRKDSTIYHQTLEISDQTSDRKYLASTVPMDLPANTLNNYFVKYEFYNHFKVAAFEIRTYAEFIRANLIMVIIFLILFTSIFLILVVSILFFLLNKEPQYLFYGLHTLTFGIFAVASRELFYIFPRLSFLAHSTFIYYVPFSLSTIFFVLYIISSLKNKNQLFLIKALKALLVFKFFTILLLFVDSDLVESAVTQYFAKTDVIIYALVFWLVLLTTIRNPLIINWWLTIGVSSMLIGQVIHLLVSRPTNAIFGFICFDILWFGVGLSINYRIAKNEKVNALKELIQVKDSYNNELVNEVEKRTRQLQEKIELIDKLNSVLESHNISLSQNVSQLEEVRILNKELSFEEFRAQFPDKESCQRLLAKIKWNGSFLCNVCGNTQYLQIRKTDPFMRKCMGCNKIHSATTDTIFHNIKFPLENAFYILFVCTSTKKYTIDSISKMISLRPATITNFRKKIEAAMESKKFTKNASMTWQDLIF